MLLPPACLMGLLLLSMSLTSAGCVCLVRLHTYTHTNIHTNIIQSRKSVRAMFSHPHSLCIGTRKTATTRNSNACMYCDICHYIPSDSLDARPQTNPANSTCTHQIVTKAPKRDSAKVRDRTRERRVPFVRHSTEYPLA